MTTIPKEPSFRKRLSYHSSLLGITALLVSVSLVLGDLHTRDDIALRLAEDIQASLRQVIPDELYDNDLLQDTVILHRTTGRAEGEMTVYRARKEGQIAAFAFEASTQEGYNGTITLMVGVDKDSHILGVRVISHSETPGLGDKVETQKSDWISGFNGLSLDNTPGRNWKVKKDGGQFDQFTGATITPRAIVKAVHNSLVFIAKHRTEIFAEQTTAEE